jgi:hypothetical protein
VSGVWTTQYFSRNVLDDVRKSHTASWQTGLIPTSDQHAWPDMQEAIGLHNYSALLCYCR